jgi:hypothetical protein
MKLVSESLNEIQNFERRNSPKSSMGLGGINFQEISNEWHEEFTDLIRNTLQNKTIIFEGKKFWMDGGVLEEELGTYTVTPKVVESPSMDSMIGFGRINWKLIVRDDKFGYDFKLDQKVKIE